jgi:GGDEF domain-containing protein
MPELLAPSGPRTATGTTESPALTRALDRFAQGLRPTEKLPARDRAPRSAAPGQRAPAAHDPGLCGHILTAITAGRTRHGEVSLVLWEMDHQADLLLLHGPEQAARILESVPDFVAQACDVANECLLVGKARFAIVLRECDRGQATAIARTLLERWPKWVLGQRLTAVPIASSAGVATLARPSRHSHPEDLIEAAERCLFAAQASGGHVVKSIDVLA